jgi:hypothetical protein
MAGFKTKQTPFPYTVSSVADMAAIASSLVELERFSSSILVQENLRLMQLSLAYSWATPPAAHIAASSTLSIPRRPQRQEVPFCGTALHLLLSSSLKLGARPPLLLLLAAQPHWAALDSRLQHQTGDSHRASAESVTSVEALAALPDVLAHSGCTIADEVVRAICSALPQSAAPITLKV